MPRITNRLLTSPEQGLPEAQKRNARQNAGIEDFVSSAEATSSQLKLHFKESGTVTFSPVLPQPEPGQEYNVMATNGEGTYGWTEGVLEIRDSSGTKIQPVAGAVQLPPMDQSDWTADEGTPAAILHKPGIEQAAEGGTTESLVSTGEKYAWNNKVDQVAGKGLSTEDYTTDEKNKLSGIASGAQVNVIESVQLNGTVVTPSGKTVNIQLDKSSVGLGNVDNTSDNDKPISTATQSALDGKADKATTLAGYGITDAYTKTEVYTKEEVNTELGKVGGFRQADIDRVTGKPVVDNPSTKYIYLTRDGEAPEPDKYNEWIWIEPDGEEPYWDMIGDTSVSLDGVIEQVQVAGVALSKSNKTVNVPEAGGTAGAWVKGVVSGEDKAKWNSWGSNDYDIPVDPSSNQGA